LLIAELRDRDLVRLYWPAELRPAFDALFAIDDAMADVVVRATQPALGAIKLAWWRERLEELDKGKVPAEPRLQAAATELLPRGINGVEIARLEAGWAAMLQEQPAYDVAWDEGVMLFRVAARLLAPDPAPMVEAAGQVYAAAHLTRLGLARDVPFAMPDLGRIDWKFRPLTGLAALGARDLRKENSSSEPEGTPGRAWALLRHRLTGGL